MRRDRRLTGTLRGQTDKAEAPLGFELNNPWAVSTCIHSRKSMSLKKMNSVKVDIFNRELMSSEFVAGISRLWGMVSAFESVCIWELQSLSTHEAL